MLKRHITILFFLFFHVALFAQVDSTLNKRLDFARSYIEVGGSCSPSFTGKKLTANGTTSFDHSASVIPYINWGAFHFWGHAEFYVSFPVGQLLLESNEDAGYDLSHSTVTGARILPWAYEPKKIRPYVGAAWSASAFKQTINPDTDQPILAKDFNLVPEAGLVYGSDKLSFRLGAKYYSNTEWDYALSKTEFTTIHTPKLNLQFGILYSYEGSRKVKKETQNRWNSYERTSRIGAATSKMGDFFIGAGPSNSFSLNKSQYNKSMLPYLNDKQVSNVYVDISAGYQFHKPGMFAAVSYRNPKFKKEGYGSSQQIEKTAIALEAVKYFKDYTGFVPYVGLNASYDKLVYTESSDNGEISVTKEGLEPGITFGWDIVPGKTDEAFILRTNLRWYPLSEFEVNGKTFQFSQLEYNLIQAVFYPGRRKSKK